MRLAELGWVNLRSEEWNLACQVHCLLDLVSHFELVAWLFVENEGCIID